MWKMSPLPGPWLGVGQKIRWDPSKEIRFRRRR